VQNSHWIFLLLALPINNRDLLFLRMRSWFFVELQNIFLPVWNISHSVVFFRLSSSWSISWSGEQKLYLLQFLFCRPLADLRNKSFTYYSSFLSSISWFEEQKLYFITVPFFAGLSWSEDQKLYLLQFLFAGPSADLRNKSFIYYNSFLLVHQLIWGTFPLSTNVPFSGPSAGGINASRKYFLFENKR
jgi:hypothetical protein